MRVVKAQWKSHHQQRPADFDGCALPWEVLRRGGVIHRVRRQCSTFDLEGRDVDDTASIPRCAPTVRTVAMDRHRKLARLCEISRIRVQFDLDPIGTMVTRFVNQHMAAGD